MNAIFGTASSDRSCSSNRSKLHVFLPPVGTIPTEIGDLTALEHVDFSDNKLQGKSCVSTLCVASGGLVCRLIFVSRDHTVTFPPTRREGWST